MKKDCSAIVSLLSAMTIYVGCLLFIALSLSRLLWVGEYISLIIWILVGISAIVPAIIHFYRAVIKIKNSNNLSTAKMVVLIASLIMTPMASFVVYRFIDRHVYEVTYTFTPIKWENADIRDRSRLIESFREQYDLVGQRIETCVDLLGEPDIKEVAHYTYDLGDFDTMFAIDPYYYLVTFDANDIITGEGVFQG